MKKRCKYLFGLLLLFISLGCSNEQECYVSFIGDSEVARWDLPVCFPTIMAENRGVSGSGVEYLESQKGTMTNKDVVVLSGTNDLALMRSDMTSYFERYIKAIEALGGQKTYIISVLPRSFKGDKADMNRLICDFNTLLKENCQNYGFTFVDVHHLFLRDGAMNMQYSYDGLHLNYIGYELISYELGKYIMEQ